MAFFTGLLRFRQVVLILVVVVTRVRGAAGATVAV